MSMKKYIFALTVATALLALLPGSTAAQEADGFKAVNVQKEFTQNAFTFFTNAPILASGDTTAYNAMTIGWGAMGNYLGYQRPTVTVYVAPGRYTYQFMEKYPRFTVMEFDDLKVIDYMGSKSGRDGDKAAALGLHVAYTKNGTPYFKEAKSIIECEIMTVFHQTGSDFRNGTPGEAYKNFAPGIHAAYIAEVIGAWVKP
jgi:flavin reductase (DIM6/NTAB) family NADH-FMN oxidoreductase RutF